MKKTLRKIYSHWSHKPFSASALSALGFFGLALVVNYMANIYAEKSQSNYVNDIILDNIPVLKVGLIVVYGALALSFFIFLLVMVEPKRMPFITKSVALFYLIRAFFITLTHIRPFPEHVLLKSNDFFIGLGISQTADLFFSGHTGLPFLMALIFWQYKKLRVIFLSISLFFAIVVLLGHLHYSIDVFAAFFITYAIFDIAKWLFKKDYKLFLDGI
jgi:hypothetical protein